MSHKNDDFDAKIRQALAEDEADLGVGGGEQGIFEMMIGMYRGRLLWLNILVSVFQLLFMGLAVWSALRFFEATEIKDLLFCSTLFLWSVGVTGMFKIWFWMVMNRNSLLREVKRLELEVAQLRSASAS